MDRDSRQAQRHDAAVKRFWRKHRARDAYAFEVKLIPTMALFIVLVAAVAAGYRYDNTPTHVQAETVEQAAPVALPTPVVEAPPVDLLPTVVADMNSVIANYPKLSGSATLIDLTTGTEYSAGKYTQTFEAASTSKLVAVFDYIHEVELGKATLDKTIEGQSAQDIIKRMIVNSDNDAWDKLNRTLKFKHQQAYLDGIGVGGKMVYDNIQFSTPAMAKLLQLLYDGKLMNEEHQAMVLDYMSHTTMNRLIPAALPTDATVYHKYGQIDGVLHDASIVEYQGHEFVLVVYTDGGQYATQTNLIHDVTTAAFNDVVKSSAQL